MIKLASSYSELIDVSLTPRSVKKDIGDFVELNVKIGAVEYSGVPAMIRDFGYDPSGFAIPCKMWCFGLVPFPGWTPGYSGIVGGYNATITKET